MNPQFQKMFLDMQNTMTNLDQQMQQLRNVFGQSQFQAPLYPNGQPSPNMMAPLIVTDVRPRGDKLIVNTTVGPQIQQPIECTREELLMKLSNTGIIGTRISTTILNNPMLAGLGLRGWIITDHQAILTVPMMGSAVFDPVMLRALPIAQLVDLRPVQVNTDGFRGSSFGQRPTKVSWVGGVRLKEPGIIELAAVTYGEPNVNSVTLPIDQVGMELHKYSTILNPGQLKSTIPTGHVTAWVLDDQRTLISVGTMGSTVISTDTLDSYVGVLVDDLRPKQPEQRKENGDALNPEWVTEMVYLGDNRWSVKQVSVANDDSSPAFISGLSLKETVVEHNIESLMELGVGDEYLSMQFDSLIGMVKPENLKVWKLNGEHVLISIELFGCSIYSTGVLDAIEGISFIDVSSTNTIPVENTPYVYSRKNRKHDLASLSIDSAELINDPTSNFNQHYRFTFLPNNPSEAKVTVLVPKKDVAYLLDAECSTITAQGLHAMVRRQNAAATNQSTFTVVDIESVGQCLVQVLNGDVRNNYYLPSKSALKAFAKLVDDTYLRQFAI